jgi:hypothetical protein
MFWIVFLRKDVTVFHTLIESDFTSILSIAADVTICILIFTWFLSARGGIVPGFLRMIIFGMVLFRGLTCSIIIWTTTACMSPIPSLISLT